ncbi:MAG: hypothetical protein LW834_00595, partial [Cyanobium sp. 49614_E6]|nr:hypothetical protein [Cyanobium sp. 49614_E6]
NKPGNGNPNNKNKPGNGKPSDTGKPFGGKPSGNGNGNGNGNGKPKNSKPGKGRQPAAAYDYAGELEKQISPLRQQITDLQNAGAGQDNDWRTGMTEMFDQFRAEQQMQREQEQLQREEERLQKEQEQTAKATSGGGITDGGGSGLSKPSYGYNPGGNTISTPDNTTASLYDNWQRSEASNRASTAYQFAPGGTRRQEEPTGAADATASNGSSSAKPYWSPDSANEMMRDWQSPERDEDRSRSSRRFAGGIFDMLSAGGSQSSF